MAEITAALVKDLRETTGAGMMDCKKALVESDGDMQGAIDWLRKKGLSAAAKKSGRVAAEGLIGIALAPGKAAMVEINAETDFVARNEAFQAFVETAAKIALETGEDAEALKAAAYPGTGRTVAEELVHLVATIGENMNVRRVAVVSVPGGVAASYVHGALKPGLGKIGVIVGLEGAANEAIEALGRAGARARDPDRAGPRLRQAGRGDREDGRRPDQEILRGCRAAGAGLGA
jgi:elongation factor Ts